MKQPRKVDINQPAIVFDVIGDAVPKQSFRYGNGHGYQPDRVTAWETAVAWAAAQAMTGRAPLTGPLSVRLDFHLPTRRRVDCDNLAKAALDGCTQGGLMADDSQIVDLHIVKHYVKRDAAGLTVRVTQEPMP